MTFTVSGTDGLTFPDSSTQAKSAANGQTGSAPFYSARAWVNFNGTGTVAIRASGNVSSITDNGTGDYTVNFTNALPNANYSLTGTCSGDDTARARSLSPYGPTTMLTTSVRIATGYSNTTLSDGYAMSVAVFL